MKHLTMSHNIIKSVQNASTISFTMQCKNRNFKNMWRRAVTQGILLHKIYNEEYLQNGCSRSRACLFCAFHTFYGLFQDHFNSGNAFLICR